MHVHALQHLEGQLQPGMSALDVGSGSGYLTACMAYMVGDQGKVRCGGLGFSKKARERVE